MISQPIRPMRLVVGGILDLRDIVGRDRLAGQICGQLTTGDGVLLTGDRRIGKTTLSRLVEARLRSEGHPVIRVSAERSSYDDFARALADQVRHETASRFAAELDQWQLGIRAGPVDLTREPTNPSLDRLIQIAIESASKRPVFIVDEVPVLARAMEQAARGSGTAMLHTLRRVRQENSGRASMLLLGSIGFHHVSAEATGTVNDVVKQSAGPISAEDAAYLARCLILGEGVDTSDEAAVATAIADAAEGVPYYVQHLVASCRNDAAITITPEDIPRLVDSALTHPDDPWNMRHYRDRIPLYYGDDQADLVSAVIDVYADEQGLLSVDSALRLVHSQPSGGDLSRGDLVGLVEKLEQDHYLERSGNDSRFRSELVRRAWLATRR
ncbi:MAG TPA: ATP-binding protein [Dermatophilaceae bacterium]|nr:ATP-binding protein [Dermatophilaceae bacterium]